MPTTPSSAKRAAGPAALLAGVVVADEGEVVVPETWDELPVELPPVVLVAVVCDVETDVETVVLVLVPPAEVVEADVVVDPPAGTLVETPWPTQAVLVPA